MYCYSLSLIGVWKKYQLVKSSLQAMACKSSLQACRSSLQATLPYKPWLVNEHRLACAVFHIQYKPPKRFIWNTFSDRSHWLVDPFYKPWSNGFHVNTVGSRCYRCRTTLISLLFCLHQLPTNKFSDPPNSIIHVFCRPFNCLTTKHTQVCVHWNKANITEIIW